MRTHADQANAGSVSVGDRRFHCGGGPFEATLVDRGRITLQSRHLQRLQQGAQRRAISLTGEAQFGVDDLRRADGVMSTRATALVRIVASFGKHYCEMQGPPLGIRAGCSERLRQCLSV